MDSKMVSASRTRDWLYLALFIVVILLITGIPYFYAQRIAQPNNQFMGVVENIPDHFQYFSWMRESQDKFLVPNQLTPETSAALLFNLVERGLCSFAVRTAGGSGIPVTHREGLICGARSSITLGNQII